VLYRILADLVVVAHLSFIAFVAVGSLLVWKWPRLLWPHVAVVAWAAAIVNVGFTCPLTPLEQLLRNVPASPPTTADWRDTRARGSRTPAGRRLTGQSGRPQSHWSITGHQRHHSNQRVRDRRSIDRGIDDADRHRRALQPS
jgi:hypothetical protein